MPSEDSPGVQPAPLCPDGGSAHNISWLGFVAAEGDYQIKIKFQNCVAEDNPPQVGVQVGMYTNCNFTESVFCFPDCSLEDITISSSILEAGSDYYFFIDGCFGTVCDYEIEIVGDYTETQELFGNTFIDLNNNGTQENFESNLDNVNLTINPGNITVLSDDEGNYAFPDLSPGSYTLTAMVTEGDWILDEVSIDFEYNGTCKNINIGFFPAPPNEPAVLASVTNTLTRCNASARFNLSIQNISTATFDGSFEFEFDPLTTFISSNIPGAVVEDNRIKGNFTQLETFEILKYDVYLLMPNATLPLPVLGFDLRVFDTDQNELPNYAYNTQLRCSYDPNDKINLPDRPGEENLTLFEEEMEYKIRFQNNGNDTAFLVRIVDELDPNIEKTSIRVINSSHPVKTTITGNTLEFLFDDIMLVDSTTNYVESQGFVTFRCNAVEDIMENTEVRNTAAIYFDLNDAIITNTTLNTFVSELCTSETVNLSGEICPGESFFGYDSTGVYTEVVPLEFGCDSTTIIDVTVLPEPELLITVDICEGDDFIGYDSTGIYTIVMPSTLGCDSTTTIDLTVLEPISVDLNIEICEGDEFMGYSSTGIYTEEATSALGCDSTTIIDLTVVEEITVDLNIQICEGEAFMGYDSTGIYTEENISSFGCDSTTIIDLTINTSTEEFFEFDVCPGESLAINDEIYFFDESSVLVDTLYDEIGCIQTISSFDITVLETPDIQIDTTICEGMDFNGWTETGVYELESFDTTTGCEFIAFVNLEVLPMSDPECIVSTEEIKSSDVKMYPNPARDVLFIEADKKLEEIEIYTMDYRKILTMTPGVPNVQISLSSADLSAGLHLIRIKVEDGYIFRKLVIDR